MARWLVTGCSSGLGRALAAAAAAAGDQVVATTRRPAAVEDLVASWPDSVVPVPLDVRDAHQCEQAVVTAAERLGGVDVLVNNAGAGIFGAVEEICDDELRDQFEAQVVGPWRLIRLVLPMMRAQGAGHIVNVSSIAGRMAVPGLAAYISAKHALEGMSQALAAEVAAHGIRVTVMEPGGYATRYGTSLAVSEARLPAYGEVHDSLGMYRGMADNPELGRADDFAQAVLKVVASAPPTPLRIPVGPGAYEMLTASHHASREELDTAAGLMGQSTLADGAVVA